MHMTTHTGEKVHKCAECGDLFGRARYLKSHMLTHSGEKPHKCPQCDYASSRAGHLRDHIKTHSLEKPYQCKWCDYSSITKSYLAKHILIHSGEKPHHCKECGSSFSQAQHTSASTPEKNHISAHSVVTQVLNHVMSNDTWPNIQQPLTSFFLFQYYYHNSQNCPP